MKRDSAAEQYLEQAQSWELDRARRADRAKFWVGIVAAGFASIAVLEGIALTALIPLKQVETVIVRVHETTGIVDVVPKYEGTTDPGELVTRTLLNSYVTSRERYFYGTAESDYELVAAMQTPQLNQAWTSSWDRANPQSPLNVFKDGTTVRVQIRAISFLKMQSGKEVAQVRFTKYARPGGTGDEQPTHWVSTIDFSYSKPSKDEKLRSMNPLGFKVVEYQREPEVAGQAAVKGGS